MNAETIIRGLTIGSLAGLLLGVGLRLTVGQVVASVRKCRLILIIAVNFLVIPALAVAATHASGIDPALATGIILLAAAPFAPVVPVFTRMAKADLALAAGLAALFPVLSAFLTPLVLGVALLGLPASGPIQFNTGSVLITLLATLTLPLGLGMAVHRASPHGARLVLRPIEIVSEAAGACSLAFVTFTEGRAILTTGWVPLLIMALLCEISLAIGYAIGGPERNMRRVIGLGTSNRNIALALLVALSSFAGTPVVPAVVANGLVLIFLGLLHVAFWRFGSKGKG